MRVLVTGGAGYIGSHTVLALLTDGHDVTVLDNFQNSSPTALKRVGELAGAPVPYLIADLSDAAATRKALVATAPDVVVHFAGLKSVGESTINPLRYFASNIGGTLNLLEAMEASGVRRLLFSSSATVYGAPRAVPVSEEEPLSATSPYGRTKLVIEQMLGDLAAADNRWSIGMLRYFNPVGAHPSGRLGEDPRGLPANLVPFVGQVAIGKLPFVRVFGSDYETPDGTGIRDFIHVLDLAEGHVAALDWIASKRGAHVWNLGTGRGYSVLEVLDAYSEAAGRDVPYRFAERRPGDVPSSFAETAKAERELNWKARRGLREMVEDHWRWQQLNPGGYEE
ncbi:UDP-glucose 4-epimerase GalE [Sinomonas terrae]|uniref:UDP-glucose 4-epimerase n=1 Tax=Sinomonas terrae TaxID=2908838 RepID=A0ABS9TY70_9MICC|nr:UDP-glucose 4-epimerase GalE [Sinomonas terrae]MCH6469384.1 UDP-glucose 4-epimerase GalE [Sinomonas terrae]